MGKVKRKIIMAAGLGRRMKPVSNRTPKPLIKVNGKRMIETIIEGLCDNGITEIHVVAGYKKDAFEVLRKRYPEIDIIENPYFATCNNISSLYVARHHLEESIIVDGDQIIHNPEILDAGIDKSGYSGAWTETDTDEWLMEVNRGIITKCDRNGGRRGWQLFGISRWTGEDGKKLKKHLEIEFEEKKKHNLYWDDVPMFRHKDEYELQLYPIERGDIIEIDNFEELVRIDGSYKNYEL